MTSLRIRNEQIDTTGLAPARLWPCRPLPKTLPHCNSAARIAWSHDGQCLAFIDGDGGVTFWDVSDGEITRERVSTKPVQVIAWSGTDNRIAIAMAGNRIRIWDTDSRRILNTLQCRGACSQMAWSSDGRRLAVREFVSDSKRSTASAIVSVWDASSGCEIPELPGGGDSMALAWEPNGTRLAEGDYRQYVHLWDANTGEELRTLRGHRGSVDQVAWSPDGTRLASGSRDETVKIWDTDSGEEIRTLRGHTETVGRLKWSPDGRHLVSSSPNEIKVWDVDANELTQLGEGSTIRYQSALSADVRRVVSVGKDQTVRFCDVATGKELHVPYTGQDNEHPVAVVGAWGNSFCWSTDSRHVAWAETDGSVRIWDTLANEHVRWLRGHAQEVRVVAWSPDGQYVATVDPNSIKIWDSANGQETRSWKTHRPRVRALAWSHDCLASSAWDGAIKLWNPTTGRLQHILLGHQKWIGSLAFSSDGQFLASGGWDQVVNVWEVATGKEIFSLQGHTAKIESLAWHPDGQRLASVGGDRTVRIWDVTTSQEIFALDVPESCVEGDIAWSPDGHRLVVVGGAAVKVWDASRGYELSAGNAFDWAGELADAKQSKSQSYESLASAYRRHGYFLTTAEELDEAVRAFEREVELRRAILALRKRKLGPEHPQTLLSMRYLARALRGQGQYAEAEKLDWEVLEGRKRVLGPEHPDTLAIMNNLANWISNHERPAEAEELQREVLEIQQRIQRPEHPRTLKFMNNLALSILRQGRYAEAAEYYQDAINLRPNPPSYSGLGDALGKQGDLPAAIDAYQKAVELHTNGGGPHITLGLALHSNGQSLEAIMSYKKALRFFRRVRQAQPSNKYARTRFALALNNLAHVLSSARDTTLRDPVRAVDLARQAVDVEPQNATFQATLGQSQYRNGAFRASVDSLQSSIQLSKNGDYLTCLPTLYLAMAHWRLGERDAARESYDYAVAWMKGNGPDDEELRRVHAEAQELLKIPVDAASPSGVTKVEGTNN